ncbi:MAG: DMT family transporter [Rhodospirillaceae bacterium]|jgi:drug/metabolite transporter (DMT)-like permease|nr:DMT family transporter [Rhodospirillaceae bacterium]
MKPPPPLTRLTEIWLELPANLRGFIWLSAGTLIVSVTDAAIKMLGRTIPPVELVFFRYVVGIIVLMPLFYRMGFVGLKTQRPGPHICRLFLATLGQTGIFISIVHMNLADATALMFSKPLFTTIIAVLFLSELVSGRRWTATIIGFAGVIVMLRPGAGVIDPYALVAVGAALSMAMANALIRFMAPTEPPTRILFYYHLGGVFLLAGPAFWVWQTPEGTDWLLIFLLGCGQTLAMICYVRAFSVGEANAIGPSEYARLIYAGLIGVFIFGETIDIWTLVGITIIAAATLYIAREESRKPGA